MREEWAWVVAMMLAALLLIVLVWLVWVTVKLKKSERRLNKMINGTGVENLEELIASMQKKIGWLQSNSDRHEAQLKEVLERMVKLKSHVGIHRYNAFSEGGSDLSFSVAIVDEQRTGVVMTGLHNREDTYIYAKPLDHGESKHALSPEEKMAINQALSKA